MAEADWAYSHYWRCRKEEFGASIQQVVQQGSWKPPHSMKCKFFEPGTSLDPHFLPASMNLISQLVHSSGQGQPAELSSGSLIPTGASEE